MEELWNGQNEKGIKNIVKTQRIVHCRAECNFNNVHRDVTSFYRYPRQYVYLQYFFVNKMAFVDNKKIEISARITLSSIARYTN